VILVCLGKRNSEFAADHDNWGMTGRDREYVSTLQKALAKMTPEDHKLLFHMVQKVAKRK
jgi:cation transport regulator ChaC